ncbi:Hemin transport protein [Lysobacter sp. K5869]|uniref:Hemin transport protein n=1 Tax=Lysobacter sp. K5869 TaxID=2820808 RepID=UPI001C063C0B|nr:Hemin transport protein [Lysobacter sp. K5869]QWP76632.1 Hemin transport protein [Lysobacter sp. K5869]
MFALLPGHGGARGALPAPERLAAVATVLCLRPRRQRDALEGWRAAREARRLGDGADEALSFRDAAGRECWRLYLLADSDFLAWDDAAASLACVPSRASAWAAAARWWRRLRGGSRAQALRLSVLRDEAGHCVLLAEAAALSSLGRAQARRIADAAGVRLDEDADACCCLAPPRR